MRKLTKIILFGLSTALVSSILTDCIVKNGLYVSPRYKVNDCILLNDTKACTVWQHCSPDYGLIVDKNKQSYYIAFWRIGNGEIHFYNETFKYVDAWYKKVDCPEFMDILK